MDDTEEEVDMLEVWLPEQPTSTTSIIQDDNSQNGGFLRGTGRGFLIGDKREKLDDMCSEVILLSNANA